MELKAKPAICGDCLLPIDICAHKIEILEEIRCNYVLYYLVGYGFCGCRRRFICSFASGLRPGENVIHLRLSLRWLLV